MWHKPFQASILNSTQVKAIEAAVFVRFGFVMGKCEAYTGV